MKLTVSISSLEVTTIVDTLKAIGVEDTSGLLKLFKDIAYSSDVYKLTSTKYLEDSIDLTDTLTVSIGKILEDRSNTHDFIQIITNVKRTFEEAVLAIDSGEVDVYFLEDYAAEYYSAAIPMLVKTLKTLEDSVVFFDEVALSNIKLLSDSVLVTDTFYTQVTSSLADISIFLDLVSFKGLKEFFDTCVTFESGLIHKTDYADLTYFAEDYIGTIHTF